MKKAIFLLLSAMTTLTMMAQYSCTVVGSARETVRWHTLWKGCQKAQVYPPRRSRQGFTVTRES